MGYAKVISGGDLGRYTIELDYGSTTRTALLAALDTLLADLTAKTAAAQIKVTAADYKEAEQRLRVSDAQAAYIEASASAAPGSPGPDPVAFKFEVLQLTKLQTAHAPLRLALQALKFDQAQAQKRRAYWDAFNAVETRGAWCTDYTLDAAAGSYVATVDVPGESALILLAPGARAWQAGDGLLTARELMSPEQAYFNAAILPGWQKFKPTYRWGTITALNKDGNTADVALFDARSSAQRLPVNQASFLAAVPVTYMECHAEAFEVGDRCIVQFEGQNWTAPRVIGFVDSPKPCIAWPDVEVKVRFRSTARTTGASRQWMVSQSDGFCGRDGSVAGVITTNPFDYFLTFSLDTPAFVTPYPTATLDCALPEDQYIGTNTYLQNHVPSGSSPGVFLDFLSSYGNQIAVAALSFPFAEATVTNYIREGDLCISPITKTAPYFSTQPIGSGMPEAEPETSWQVSPQPITSFLSILPTVAVTLLGRTKVYVVKDVSFSSASGFVWTLTFGKT